MEKATVCLISPPSVFLLDDRVFMTLGILKVAAALEEAGHPVEMLDLAGIENFADAAAHHALSSDARLFGLTATTPQLPAAIRIRDSIRQARPDARLVLGGPHITLVNAARKRELKLGNDGRACKAYRQLEQLFDILIAGDGEDAILGAIPNHAPKLIDADDTKSSLFLTNARVTELPMPARHLVDVDSYNYTIEGVRALSLIAQLGCPFGCGFCGGRESPMLRKIRVRPTDSVVREIAHLHDTYGVTGFMLYDDELNVNPKMTDLMRAIGREARLRGVEWRLRGFIKAELFTEDQAEAMYEAGFRWILTGFESGSPRILRNINKKATLEENTRCVGIARRHNLKVKALMSIGHPGESPETVAETHRWLLEVQPEDFDVTIITTYPGTPYYDHALRDPGNEDVWIYSVHGDRLYSYDVDYTRVADYYKGDPNGGYQSFVFTDYMSADELVKARNHIEADVREKLGIPFNGSASAIQFEHSMGQPGAFPQHILRVSNKAKAAAVGSPFPVLLSRSAGTCE